MPIKDSLEKDYSHLDSFVIYMCICGSIDLMVNKTSYSLQMGETILLPASIEKVQLNAEKEAEVLEIYY